MVVETVVCVAIYDLVCVRTHGGRAGHLGATCAGAAHYDGPPRRAPWPLRIGLAQYSLAKRELYRIKI